MNTDKHSWEKKVDVRQYIGILFFRWKIILACFLWCLLGGVLYITFSPPIYESRSMVRMIHNRALDVTKQSSYGKNLQQHTYDLQSDEYTRHAIDELYDEWGEAVGSRQSMALPVTVTRVRQVPNSLMVSVRSSNRKYAEAFLSKILEVYEQRHEAFKEEIAVETTKVLQRELSRLEDEIRNAENDLIEFQRLHNLAYVQTQASQEARYLEALIGRRNQIATEMMLLDAQNPILKNADAAVLENLAGLTQETGSVAPLEEMLDPSDPTSSRLREGNNSVSVAEKRITINTDQWQELQVKKSSLEVRMTTLLETRTENHPDVRALQSDIAKLENQLEILANVSRSKIQSRYKALRTHYEALQHAERTWQANNLLSSKRRAEYKRIAEEVKRHERLYFSLYSRLFDLKTDEKMEAEKLQIGEVVTPDTPVWPSPSKILLMVVAMGLGSGLGLGLVLHMLDNKLQSIADIEEDLGVPFLGGVPLWIRGDTSQTVRPIVTEERSTGAVEAYRALRTNILSALEKTNDKFLIVTSADSKEGKTLTTLNTAIMMANAGMKVLLLDMDLRRGRLHRSLDVLRAPGVADALSEDIPLKDVIKETRIENLYLAPCGKSVDNISEILQATDIQEFLSEAMDEYDLIIADTSPVLRVTDTVILASQGVGAVIYVAHSNRTPKPLIRYSLDLLSSANVAGLILNSINMHQISSLYYAYQYPNYAYYSNAYAYGYDYYYGDDNSARRSGKSSLSSARHRFASWVRRNLFPSE